MLAALSRQHHNNLVQSRLQWRVLISAHAEFRTLEFLYRWASYRIKDFSLRLRPLALFTCWARENIQSTFRTEAKNSGKYTGIPNHSCHKKTEKTRRRSLSSSKARNFVHKWSGVITWSKAAFREEYFCSFVVVLLLNSKLFSVGLPVV